MEDKALVAILSAFSAITGGLISAVLSPLVKHWLDQGASRRNRQREQIQNWRRMVLDVNGLAAEDANVGPILQLHSDFLSLEPLLTKEARSVVYTQNRTFVVGSALPAPLSVMTKEIARIEKSWGLHRG